MRLSEAINITVTERAVLKAPAARLLRDFAEAARLVRVNRILYGKDERQLGLLAVAQRTRSRTRYAALMTAFGL